MKTKRVKQKFNRTPMGIFLVMILTGIISCTAEKPDDFVHSAYELRINGHADSAQLLLQQITAENPENAQAWYELCRVTQQLGMSNPRKLQESMDKALKYIDKAVATEPENVWYLSYKGKIETLQFYMGLQMGNENAAAYLDKLEDTYNSVFQMDNSYTEDKLTLVEFFGGLPPEMGGNLEKAEKYAAQLQKVNSVAGAKATELLMPEDTDYVEFWGKIINENPDNADALQALGRIYLFMEDFNQAANYYQKAIELDPSKNVLYLDLGRYYIISAMRNPAVLDSVSPKIEEQFNKYLNSKPEPINPMKAWTYGTLAMINQRVGNTELAEQYGTISKDLDPFRSFATAKPGKALYCPPDVMVHEQGYYLSPF